VGEKKDVPLRRALQTIPATESNLGGDFLAYVYGPVPSWRLGRSLGIDLLSVREKTCPFDCIYCQLGRTVNKQIRREKFIDLRLLQAELETIKDKVRADYATFSGTGEPTLACNLGKAIELVKNILSLPVAILTNAALLKDEEVLFSLLKADLVIAKLDASRIAPDEVQINTPIRPCPVKPLSQEEIAAIQREFFALKKVTTLYESTRPIVAPLNLAETIRRRPG
jgi:organic radical activating enzyme